MTGSIRDYVIFIYDFSSFSPFAPMHDIFELLCECRF